MAALHRRERARKLLYAYPGYVRVPDPDRLRNGRSGGRTGQRGSYKKGWELRLVVPIEDVDRVRELIDEAGLPLAKPFMKGRQLIQPVYGYEVVNEYLAANGRLADEE